MTVTLAYMQEARLALEPVRTGLSTKIIYRIMENHEP